MSSALLRQALGRAARALGVRAESRAAAAGAAALAAAEQRLAALGAIPSADPALRPYYEELANMTVQPAASAKEASDSERAAELALFRMHNMSLPRSVYEGHMIKATVLEVGRRTLVLDTGLKPARVARSDITPECIVGSTVPDATPRRPGEVREGDVVQVFLESAGTPEGDFLVSGVQAAVQRRMAAVWNELEERKERGEMVKGRILNTVYHGYAVGVAGIVGFLPARQCARPTARRIGQLQKFRILEVDRARPTLVLSDPNLDFPQPESATSRRARRDQAPSSFVAPRRPRSEEEARRRQELSRVADELRSVLALRSSEEQAAAAAGGSSGSNGGGVGGGSPARG